MPPPPIPLEERVRRDGRRGKEGEYVVDDIAEVVVVDDIADETFAATMRGRLGGGDDDDDRASTRDRDAGTTDAIAAREAWIARCLPLVAAVDDSNIILLVGDMLGSSAARR